MNGSGVGLACAVVLSLVACAKEEIDEPSFLSNTGGRAASAGHSGAVGRGGSSASNTAGSAGRTSQSGTAGSLANGAGGMGVAGTSGGASSMGSAGMSGVTGSAGSGGASPVFESGTCASNPSMSLSYQQASNSSKQITGRYQFSNTTDTPIPLAQLKIRYFFSDEETSGWSTAIYDAKLEGGTGGYRPLANSMLSVSPLGATVPGADSYIELSFSSPASIEKGAIATVSWDLQPHNYNAPDQVQTDDYSYNAGALAYTVWDHVVIYQSGSLIWGCTPKAADSGNGGASGASGGTSGALNGGTSGALSGGTSGALSGGTSGALSGGTSGALSGGSSGTVNGGTSGAGAPAGGASGANAGGTAGAGGGRSTGGSSGAAAAGGLGVGGASGSSGVGGGFDAGAGGPSSSNGGTAGAP